MGVFRLGWRGYGRHGKAEKMLSPAGVGAAHQLPKQAQVAIINFFEARIRTMTEPTTPLMRQYHAIKKQHPGTLVLFRLGDFYELFFEESRRVARAADYVTLAQPRKRSAILMCGALPRRGELHRQADPRRT